MASAAAEKNARGWRTGFPVVIREAEPGFVDQGGGLEGLAGGFVGHARGREFAQFLIDKGKNSPRSIWIPLVRTVSHDRHNAHRTHKPFGSRPFLCWWSGNMARRVVGCKGGRRGGRIGAARLQETDAGAMIMVPWCRVGRRGPKARGSVVNEGRGL